MKVFDIEQRSEEWLRVRLGKPTASQFDRIITPQGKASTQAKRYKCELVYERLFGQPWEKFNGRLPKAMQDGIEQEPFAAAQFSLTYELELEPIGFVTPDHGRWGCSPDRKIKGTNDIVEIKCPTAPVQIQYLVYGPEDNYYPQMQGQLLIGGWDRCHFYSFHQELAAASTSVGRDPAYLNKLEDLLTRFADELDRDEAFVRAKGFFPKNTPSAFPDPEEGEEV